MDRIEEIARAMCDALNAGKSPIVQWDKLHREERELYETAARAAYEVMASSDGEVVEALKAADKRLCDLTPNFPPDVGPDMRDAEEIEETRAVVMQIRSALEALTQPLVHGSGLDVNDDADVQELKAELEALKARIMTAQAQSHSPPLSD